MTPSCVKTMTDVRANANKIKFRVFIKHLTELIPSFSVKRIYRLWRFFANLHGGVNAAGILYLHNRESHKSALQTEASTADQGEPSRLKRW
jgi:hypothetical protein